MPTVARPMYSRGGSCMLVAAFAAAGNNVIVDDVIYDPRVLRAAALSLVGCHALLAGVRCRREVAEQRERERGDRAAGGAAVFDALVHQHAIYDLEVDSADHSPRVCAEQILGFIQQGRRWTAVQRLAQADSPARHLV